MRPLTVREKKAYRKAWERFDPTKRYGAFVITKKSKWREVVIILCEAMQEVVPEEYWGKVKLIIRGRTMGWCYGT